MDVPHTHSVKSRIPASNELEKQRWVEEHARRLQQLFEQWQKTNSVDGEEYRKYLIEELPGYCDNSLLKSLIESIT